MRAKLALSAAALAVIVLAPEAWAHPFIDATDPPSLSNAPVGTDSVTVWYSEGVEIDFSSLEVLDSAGNRVDNADTSYHEGDSSLTVTTAPLEEGVYTVSSKVLSRVDGHLVGGAFIFAVGTATIAADAAESVAPAAQVFVTEAASRLPGLVGQIMVLGAAVGALLIWGTRRALGISDGEAGRTHRSRFMILVGAGAILVLASNIFILAAHAASLGTGILDATGTAFGGTIMIRMALTGALIAVWFAADRRPALTRGWAGAFAALGLALCATMTMIGHGAATETAPAIALDYVHNIVAGVWIGGVAYLLAVVLPALSRAGDGGAGPVRAAVSTFSAVFVACIGVVAVTGPLLMWLLEDEVALIVGSTYGTVLAAKIGLGASMVLVGAYNWTIVSRSSRARQVIAKLRRSLKIEAGLGLALLVAVALLTNTTLPGGEAAEAAVPAPRAGLDTRIFSAGAAFDVSIWPLAAGPNTVSVLVSDPEGLALDDLEDVRVKASSPGRGIPPIEAQIAPDERGYAGELTLGLWGSWEIEIEAIRSEEANESVRANVFLKPRLDDLGLEISEYGMPEGASPLHIAHDGASTVWLSDPAAPRLWSFDTEAVEFSEHAYEGAGSVTLDLAGDGRVWFTDIQSSSIGVLDPATGDVELIGVPGSLWESDGAPIPVWIEAARDGSVWVSVPNKNAIIRYDQQAGEFSVYASPTPGSAPFAVAEDAYGNIWFSEQAGGAIAILDPRTGQTREIAADPPLVSSETISFDSEGNVWISEHAEGGGIAYLDLASESFSRLAAPRPEALANSVSFDRHQNAWFALHTVDALAVYDRSSGQFQGVPIPTENSWIQFTAAGPEGNVWFAEQRPGKLGVVRISDPALVSYEEPAAPVEIGYAALAAPLMGGMVVGASLLFVSAIKKRREALGALDA